MTLSATALAPIAAQMRIPAKALVALPVVVVAAFARKAGIPEEQMVIELLENPLLRGYAAQLCVQAVQA